MNTLTSDDARDPAREKLHAIQNGSIESKLRAGLALLNGVVPDTEDEVRAAMEGRDMLETVKDYERLTAATEASTKRIEVLRKQAADADAAVHAGYQENIGASRLEPLEGKYAAVSLSLDLENNNRPSMAPVQEFLQVHGTVIRAAQNIGLLAGKTPLRCIEIVESRPGILISLGPFGGSVKANPHGEWLSEEIVSWLVNVAHKTVRDVAPNAKTPPPSVLATLQVPPGPPIGQVLEVEPLESARPIRA